MKMWITIILLLVILVAGCTAKKNSDTIAEEKIVPPNAPSIGNTPIEKVPIKPSENPMPPKNLEEPPAVNQENKMPPPKGCINAKPTDENLSEECKKWFDLQKLNEGKESAAQNAEAAIEQKWKIGGLVIKGNYADADIVDIGNGKYRMYYAIEPEVPGNNLEVFSATSTDGITWKEEGVRREVATFPDVVKLPSGKYRMYYQNAGLIKSAISDDGLAFTEEEGIRVEKEENGFEIENVGAPTTTKLEDGTYLMVYRGTINEKYEKELVPNNIMGLFFYATSTDGLHFKKKGLALDSRNTELKGWADGPEFVNWDDGTRVYFWSYKGVYYTTYKEGVFSKEINFDFTNSPNSKSQFPENPPGDPTLAKINGKWFMYYGGHNDGIYYANLE